MDLEQSNLNNQQLPLEEQKNKKSNSCTSENINLTLPKNIDCIKKESDVCESLSASIDSFSHVKIKKEIVTNDEDYSFDLQTNQDVALGADFNAIKVKEEIEITEPILHNKNIIPSSGYNINSDNKINIFSKNNCINKKNGDSANSFQEDCLFNDVIKQEESRGNFNTDTSNEFKLVSNQDKVFKNDSNFFETNDKNIEEGEIPNENSILNKNLNISTLRQVKWKTLILTDERLESLKDFWPHDKVAHVKIHTISRLTSQDIVTYMREEINNCYSNTKAVLLILNVGLHHILGFKNIDICTGHEPLEILLPETKLKNISVNKLAFEVVNKLKLMKIELKKLFDKQFVNVALLPIFPVDITKYQKFHCDLHFYQTNHSIQNMFFSPKEGKLFRDQFLKVKSIVNKWIDSDLMSYYGNNKPELMNISKDLSNLSPNLFLDGYAISNEKEEHLITLVSRMCVDIMESVEMISPTEDVFKVQNNTNEASSTDNFEEGKVSLM